MSRDAPEWADDDRPVSRAQELTLGPRRERPVKYGSQPEFQLLVKLTAEEKPDLALFRETLLAVGTRGRYRFKEGMIVARAATRFHELTGENLGPRTAYN